MDPRRLRRCVGQRGREVLRERERERERERKIMRRIFGPKKIKKVSG